MPVHRVIPYDEQEERLARSWIGVMNGINVLLYELSDGRVAGRIPSRLPLLVITTRGRTTGKLRRVTVAYMERDGAYYVVGSNGGLSTNPAWVGNALAGLDPRVTVQVGVRVQECTVERLSDDDALEVRLEMALHYAAFEDYDVRSGERKIPVLRLTPVA